MAQPTGAPVPAEEATAPAPDEIERPEAVDDHFTLQGAKERLRKLSGDEDNSS